MKPTAPYQVIHNKQAQRFEAQVGSAMAVCEYRLHDGVATIHHTEVPDALNGQGVAGALVAAALSWARDSNFRVHPTCSYVAAYIQRHPDQADLLAG